MLAGLAEVNPFDIRRAEERTGPGRLSGLAAWSTECAAMTAKPHLTHVALWTHQMDRSIDFYRKYCGLEVVHERSKPGSGRVAWISENNKKPRFVIVLIEKPFTNSAPNAFAHFGFSCGSRADVDALAEDARIEGILAMEPRDAGPIVGYHCVVNDPDGNPVEFSYGQSIDPAFFRKANPAKAHPQRSRPKRTAGSAPRQRPSRGRKR